MWCVFCHRPEPHHTQAKESYLVCSRCLQHLIKMDQEELQRGYDLATEKGYEAKAIALTVFMEQIEEIVENGETKDRGRNLERTRSMRKTRPTRIEDR